MKEFYELPSITLTKEDFGDKLWQKISELCKILANSGYIAMINLDEIDIISIYYMYDGDYSSERIVILDEDEYVEKIIQGDN